MGNGRAEYSGRATRDEDHSAVGKDWRGNAGIPCVSRGTSNSTRPHDTSVTNTLAVSSVASVGEIRSHFPALDRCHNGQSIAYFDGPGGTQVPRAVADAMVDYLYHHNANTDWAYPSSAETDAAIAYARGALADFLNASPEEIVFGANMTTLN